MAFDTKLLQPDEELVLVLRPHWFALAKPVLALIGAVVLGVVSLVVVGGSVGTVLSAVAGVVLVVALVFFLARYVRWARTWFVITSERLILQKGLVARSGTQMPLDKINTVDFRQSVFERLIGAGDLIIESGSEAGVETFTDVRDPLQVQNTLNQTMDRHGARNRGGARAATVPEQIAQLADLAARGIISSAEFETKKNELLGRM
jgi:uncharacterized membrane protein YdbT with pleckstrin-like domain